MQPEPTATTESSPIGTASPPVRTVFFGSGSFAVPILEALLAAPEVELLAVVTAPDRPAGRRHELTPVPVARRARNRGLAVLQPARVRAPEAIAAIAAIEPGLGVLADFGQIVPPALLAVPRHGILNVHPSLLPRHRGAAPIPATILAGDQKAGVTLMLMDAGLDTGPIVAVESWPLRGNESAPQLETRAAVAGARLLRRSLAGWLAGTLVPRPQPEAGVTLSRPLRREDGRLDPARQAVELERHVRAYQPWPGSFVETPAGRLIVRRASLAPGAGQPGSLLADGDGLALAAVGGRLRLDEVQLAGRRPMSSAELRRGHPELVEERVG